MRSFYAFFTVIAISSLMHAEQALWHTNPGFWEEPRIFHSSSLSSMDKEIVETQISLERNHRAETAGERFKSPNNAYFYTMQEPDYLQPSPWDTTISIYNEREGLLELKISKHASYKPTVRWINEKLLYIRIWWGRILGTDVILDVETESILYREMIHDGVIAYQQFHEEKQAK